MSTDGHGTKWRRNIAENFICLSRVHQRYRQTDDGRTMTYGEHKLFLSSRSLINDVIVDDFKDVFKRRVSDDINQSELFKVV